MNDPNIRQVRSVTCGLRRVDRDGLDPDQVTNLLASMGDEIQRLRREWEDAEDRAGWWERRARACPYLHAGTCPLIGGGSPGPRLGGGG